jgi:hypothetical protein
MGIRRCMIFKFEDLVASRIVIKTFLTFLYLRLASVENKICLSACILYIEYICMPTLKIHVP